MKIYLVGGAVRDHLLGLPIKERDYVVVGATVSDMLNQGFRQVGKEFPVFLHPKTNEEYALARMERKVKPGYQGFTFDTSPHVSLEDDLLRRDLTINAMAMTLDTHDIIDPFNGQQDIQQKILRHVSPAFAEDPVRILRVGRFYARYAYLGFQVAKETMQLMNQMVISGEVNALVAERVWKELERAFSEKNPEKFFIILDDIHALSVLFPHLALKGDGLRALITACTLTTDTQIRFAALWHDILEPKKNIAALCERYRVPHAYRELAWLTALHYPTVLEVRRLSASHLLQLMSALDVFRRESRFQKFLTTCKAIAQSQQRDIDIAWLEYCADQIKNIDVQALIAQGYEGQALATELKRVREKKIEDVLLQQK
jgi:tRNA nucleotidyltransferase (CCA-adding enzyme)